MSNRTYTLDDITAIIGIEKSITYHMVNFGVFMIILIGLVTFFARKSFESW